MLWQKLKDNNFNYKKISNVVITGGGAQLDNLDKYVGTIFASQSRVSKPIDNLNLEKHFNKPYF